MSRKKIGPYEVTGVLGRGTYATVKLATDSRTKEEVAIKIITKSGQLTKKQLKHIRTEIVVLRLVSHPNIVKLKEILASKNKIYIVMEYLEGGDILTALRENDFTVEQVRRYFIQICSALEYCQKLHISHRDIKAENLLLRKGRQSVVITDFGLSALTEEAEDDEGQGGGEQKAPGTRGSKLLTTACGSPHYVSPEVVSKTNVGYFGEKADIWSVGVLLYLMLGRTLPFQANTLEALFERIRAGQFSFPEDRVKKGYFTKESMGLIISMLNIDPAKRPSFTQILESDYVMQDKEYLDSYREECKQIYGEKQDEIFKKAQRIMSGEEKIEENNEFNEEVE
ncbi:Kinase, CAMK CAMKL [Giardia lamblia P15]|uniref:non-specific serine/threonine protein kinase n=1 Tax=Giardia intestinalis (strain P15) TaxID=658858 RepID=E1F3T4_GIAIA|nr:Kinase, CAMK CAMKL [Giardia lamblia P15]